MTAPGVLVRVIRSNSVVSVTEVSCEVYHYCCNDCVVGGGQWCCDMQYEWEKLLQLHAWCYCLLDVIFPQVVFP